MVLDLEHRTRDVTNKGSKSNEFKTVSTELCS